MPIDWFSVLAQILNFLILVWILNRFLYRPVLQAARDRQKHVEENLLAASRETEAAARERAEFENKNRELEGKREELLARAAREAEAERSRLLDEARTEFQELRKKWRTALQRKEEDLHHELTTLLQREALAVAGHLVRDLMDEDLQERLARKFIRKLEELPEDERKTLRGSPSNDEAAVVRSAFALGDELRSEVERAARGIVGPDAPLRVETKPSLGAGIELSVDGRKVSWTAEQYLASLEAELRDLVAREASLGPQEEHATTAS